MFEELTNFLRKKGEIQNILLDFIEDTGGDDIKQKQENLFKYINYIFDDSLLLEDFLIMLSTLCNNHLRNSQNELIVKIQNILLNFKDKIIFYMDDIKLFKIFRENNRILLFLMSHSFIDIEKDFIYFNIFSFDRNIAYFYPELRKINEEKLLKAVDSYHLKDFIEKSDSNYHNFLQNRNQGENESYIARVVRNDSINDFITYSGQMNIDGQKFTIERSLFETNLYLEKTYFPTIINYAAFYGSIQIIKYLLTKGLNLSSNTWFYAVHGRNYEIIHLLEEKNIHQQNHFKCFEMAVKCHHNEIGEYLLNDLPNDKNKIIESFLICLKERNHHMALEMIYKFSNFLNDKMESKDLSKLLFSFIQNKYVDIVKLFLKFNRNLINAQNSIFKFRFF